MGIQGNMGHIRTGQWAHGEGPQAGAVMGLGGVWEVGLGENSHRKTRSVGL